MEVLETDVMISFSFLSQALEIALAMKDAMQKKNKLLTHLPGAEF